MNQIVLKDYRCFGEQQTATLAPLTLLVGENSTGKTSFLALIRALWDVAHGMELPDFKEPPYDLGSFDEIAHHRGGRAGRAESFTALLTTNGQTTQKTPRSKTAKVPYFLHVTFGRRGTTPVPVRTLEVSGKNWMEKCFEARLPHFLRCGTERGKWEAKVPRDVSESFETHTMPLPPLFYLISHITEGSDSGYANFKPLDGSPPFGPEDEQQLRKFVRTVHGLVPWDSASAPVRSKPRRTYDPSRPTLDPEGEYVPMYLASLLFHERSKWQSLKAALEGFGKSAGLFDEITIRPLGKRDSEPFQVQVRKFSGKQKGPYRNLIDVGYGVSQVLPVVTDLLREDTADLFLLQQPEVHLHPSAQAALGSLFCQVAAQGRQLIVETHSDYILDRVRMDIRDGLCGLNPKDVSILFFERKGLGVQIHSLRLDEEGNVLNTPPGYRAFFMEETQRSLGL